MSLGYKDFIPTHPGLEQVPYVHPQLRVPEGEGEFGGFPVGKLAELIECDMLGIVDVGSVPYSTNMWVETKDNSGTIAAITTGLRLQSQASPSAGDDVAINGIKAFTYAANKVHFFSGTFRVSSVNASTGIGVAFGLITNGATEIMSADPADGVFAYMTEGTALVKVRFVANSGAGAGAAANTGTLITAVADTDYRVTVVFMAGSSAATSKGYIYAGAVTAGSPGTLTQLTAAQLAVLYDMLTTPPDLSAHFGERLKGTTQRNAVIRKFYAGATN